MITAHIHKALSNLNVDVQFELNQNEIIALFGPSGSGKTSILRLLSGLMVPDGGAISYGNSIWFDHQTNMSTQKRNVGYVFQQPSLFPNMTVEENLRFACKEEGSFLRIVVDALKLDELLDQKPQSLSGGQKQKVALAQSLISKPQLLLLDEPFSALDSSSKNEIIDGFQEIQNTLMVPTIFVSHNLSEVWKLASKVYQIENGLIVKHGSPEEVFHLQHDEWSIPAEVVDIQNESISISVDNQLIKIPSSANFNIGERVAFFPLSKEVKKLND